MPESVWRKYGEAAVIDFTLFETDGVNFNSDATHDTGDTKISKDEGAEINTSNGFVDNGTGFSLTLTAAETTAKRVFVPIVDQYNKQWLDDYVMVETYGHTSAMHAFNLDADLSTNTEEWKFKGIDIHHDSDVGLSITSDTTSALNLDAGGNGNGLEAKGGGSGSAFDLRGGATGRGIIVRGGSTSGDAVWLRSEVGRALFIDSQDANGSYGCLINTTSNGAGLGCVSNGGGVGVYVGASGVDVQGMQIVSGNGHALDLQGGTGTGDSDGLHIRSQSGHGIGIDAAGGNAIRAEVTSGTFDGFYVKGFNTEAGIYAEGGISGNGVEIISGQFGGGHGVAIATGASSTGNGLDIQCTSGDAAYLWSSNGSALKAWSSSAPAVIAECRNGSFSGFYAKGLGSGHGMEILGGNTGNGAYIQGGIGNQSGLKVEGQGSGDGVTLTGGLTGDGVRILGGVTSGEGVRIYTYDGNGITIDTQGTAKNGINIDSAGGNGVSIEAHAAGYHGLGIVSYDGVAMYVKAYGTGRAALAIDASDGNAVDIRAHGSGSTAHAIFAVSGTHNGIYVQSGALEGVKIIGAGAYSGVGIQGGPTGSGVMIEGGATSGDGINISTTIGHGIDIAAAGTGWKSAIRAVTTSTSTPAVLLEGTYGLECRVTSSSGAGILIDNNGPSVTNNDGIRIQSAGIGTGLSIYNPGPFGSGDAVRLSGGYLGGLAMRIGGDPKDGDANGIEIGGTGAGAAVVVTGGATGNSVEIVGGATSGDGINVTTIDGVGVRVVATGSGKHGIYVGAIDGNAVNFHGAPGWAGLLLDGFDAYGCKISGHQSKSALFIESSSGPNTGHGVEIAGGGVSGDGIHVTTTDGHGMALLASGSGKDGLYTVIDGQPLSYINELQMSRVNGKYTLDVPGVGDVTMMKRDNVTPLTVVNVTPAGRTRTS